MQGHLGDQNGNLPPQVAFQHQETHLGGLGGSNKSISPLEAIMASVGYTDWGMAELTRIWVTQMLAHA